MIKEMPEANEKEAEPRCDMTYQSPHMLFDDLIQVRASISKQGKPQAEFNK